MMGLLQKIFKGSDAALNDAAGLYRSLMTQSRKAVFFGSGKIPDSYDGRIEFLTLHMSVVMTALNPYGDQGKRLSQALFDVMVEDFDIALREEGLTDSGVKRRIKPMIALFYARLKSYSLGLADENHLPQALKSGALKDIAEPFSSDLTEYVGSFAKILAARDLGQIAKADFNYPAF